MTEPSVLAYKAYEIEEFVDVYFYRRAGYVVARLARAGHLTPNAVSILAAVIGMTGGGLIAWAEWAMAGVGLLVLHGVFDSADGQLARMTGQTSELGRILDGVAGYLTHIALYVGIVFAVKGEWGTTGALAAAVISGAATAVQAQMYDYHRTAYAGYVLKGRIPTELSAPSVSGPLAPLVKGYSWLQRSLLGRHREVEAAIAARTLGNAVDPMHRELYRRWFYRPVCGWNLLGDNVRRYAIAAFVWLQHPEWFIPFTLGPMNVALIGLWWVQQRADRRFLEASGSGSGRIPER